MYTNVRQLRPFLWHVYHAIEWQFSCRSYISPTETGLYYLQSRYYNPEWGRFLNADSFAATGQVLTGNNMFAYCGNNPTNFHDPYGTYMVPDNPLTGPVMMHVGGSGLGASSAGVGGGSGGLPVPMVDLTLYDVSKIVDIATDTADIVNGLGALSHASDYGIKGYSALKNELTGSGLEAHHIVEVRFLNGKDLDTKNALSVAVTKQEHQRFTNEWRRHFPYGKTPYKTLETDEIWAAAQKIYRNYPDLLDAVWDTLY